MARRRRIRAAPLCLCASVVQLGFLREHVELVEPAPVEADRCRDPDDLPVLGTVLAGAAELLVSGDSDLLVLGSFSDASIVTPRECYERLR